MPMCAEANGSSMRRHAASGRIFAWLTAPLLFVACGSSDQNGGEPFDPNTAFSERDSLGIPIRTTEFAVAMLPLGWTVEGSPTQQIGPADGEGFVRIVGVVAIEGGPVAVLDADLLRLFLYDESGRQVARSGGTGEGPGEFGERGRSPTVVAAPEMADSVMIYDYGLRRVTRFSIESGAFGGSERIELPEGVSEILGSVGKHILTRERTPFTPEDYQQSGPRESGMSYSWIDLATSEHSILGTWRVSLDYRIPPGDISSGPLGLRGNIPLATRPMAVLSSEGPIVSSGSSIEFRRFDLDGRLAAISRLDAPRRPITAAARRGLRDLWLVGARDSVQSGRIFDAIPLPDSMPAVTNLQVDIDGWVWVELPEWDPHVAPTWVVFDGEGRARGSVTVPPGLELQWIGRESILGVWTDELGRQFVRRHALLRH
jgi:hypothetical protein